MNKELNIEIRDNLRSFGLSERNIDKILKKCKGKQLPLLFHLTNSAMAYRSVIDLIDRVLECRITNDDHPNVYQFRKYIKSCKYEIFDILESLYL